jgi:hypothetical protein
MVVKSTNRLLWRRWNGRYWLGWSCTVMVENENSLSIGWNEVIDQI